MKKDSTASLIGIDENNNAIKFGKIDSTVSFDYLKNKFGVYFQRQLNFVDACYTSWFNEGYYNVKYNFFCDNSLNKGNPRIQIFSVICNINVYIYLKEACNYERLTYDSFFWNKKYLFMLYIYFLKLYYYS